MTELNLSSANQLSILLFGGTIKVEIAEPVLNELGQPVVFKSGQKRGQVKTKNMVKELYIKGMALRPLKEWETKKEGIYSTNESVLKVIAQREDTDAGKLASIMLKIREKEKLLSTYYIGFEELLHTDSCIHGSINHVSTDTGRTSSSKPNLQNIPRD